MIKLPILISGLAFLGLNACSSDNLNTTTDIAALNAGSGSKCTNGIRAELHDQIANSPESGRNAISGDIFGQETSEGYFKYKTDGEIEIGPVAWKITVSKADRPKTLDWEDGTGIILGSQVIQTLANIPETDDSSFAYLPVVYVSTISEPEKPDRVDCENVDDKQSDCINFPPDEDDNWDEFEVCRIIPAYADYCRINSALPKAGLQTVGGYRVARMADEFYVYFPENNIGKSSLHKGLKILMPDFAVSANNQTAESYAKEVYDFLTCAN